MKAFLRHPLFQVLAALSAGLLIGYILRPAPQPGSPLMTKAQQREAIQKAAAQMIAGNKLGKAPEKP